MKRTHFLVFTGTALLAIAAIGTLEIGGQSVTPYSASTTTSDILDVVVIVGITALTIRLLSDNLLRSLARASSSEKAIRAQADRLRESEQRYRALFEGANDAILIMNGEHSSSATRPRLHVRVRRAGGHRGPYSLGFQPAPAARREAFEREGPIEVLEGSSREHPGIFRGSTGGKTDRFLKPDISLSSVTSGGEVFAPGPRQGRLRAEPCGRTDRGAGPAA